MAVESVSTMGSGSVGEGVRSVAGADGRAVGGLKEAGGVVLADRRGRGRAGSGRVRIKTDGDGVLWKELCTYVPR